MSQIVEIKVPDIGGHENVDVIDVAVKAGDTIAVDDTLITLETDKASMEVPSTTAGIVKEVKVKVGDKVIYGQYSGSAYKQDGVEYKIIKEDDVLAILG